MVFARNLWFLKIFPITLNSNCVVLYFFYIKNEAADDSRVSFIEFRSTITNYKQYFDEDTRLTFHQTGKFFLLKLNADNRLNHRSE